MAKRPAQPRHQSGIEKHRAGDNSPPDSRVPLSAAISHLPELQEEVKEVILAARAHAAHYRSDLGSPEIIVQHETGSYSAGVSFSFGLGTIFFRNLGDSAMRTASDPRELEKWLPFSFGETSTFERAAGLMREIAKDAENSVVIKIKELWREGRIRLFGRSGGESTASPIAELPPEMWSRASIDREYCRVTAESGGGTFFAVWLERVALDVDSLSGSAARPGPATNARMRGRPPNADLHLLFEYGLNLLRRRGHFAADQPEWSCRAHLIKALERFAGSQNIERSLSSIRGDAKKILEKFERDG
jgi:hypothetical protein